MKKKEIKTIRNHKCVLLFLFAICASSPPFFPPPNDKTAFIPETIIEASAKDVDLRQLPPSDSANKKRASTDKSDEPNAKKSKSEKIDM
jgi:hypothetical protein